MKKKFFRIEGTDSDPLNDGSLRSKPEASYEGRNLRAYFVNEGDDRWVSEENYIHLGTV